MLTHSEFSSVLTNSLISLATFSNFTDSSPLKTGNVNPEPPVISALTTGPCVGVMDFIETASAVCAKIFSVYLEQTSFKGETDIQVNTETASNAPVKRNTFLL